MDDYVEDLPRDEQPIPASTQVSPPTAPAPPETTGPSSMSQQPSEHIPVTSRDFLAVMDDVYIFAATSASLTTSQTALAERIACAKVTLAQNQAILLQIQSHFGLPPVTVTAPIQPTTHGQSSLSASSSSLDVLAAVTAATDLRALQCDELKPFLMVSALEGSYAELSG